MNKLIYVLLFIVLPAACFADFTHGDFTYTTNSATATITGYRGVGGAVKIPAAIGRTPVAAIGPRSFMDNAAITSVSIPPGITTIGQRAFKGCTGLATVSIPATVATIETQAFYGCANLASAFFQGDVPPDMHYVVVGDDYPYYASDVFLNAADAFFYATHQPLPPARPALQYLRSLMANLFNTYRRSSCTPVRKTVEIGGYLALEGSSSTGGGSGAGTVCIMNAHAAAQIRQDAVVTSLQIATAAARSSAISSICIDIWRKNAAGRYDRVYSEDCIRQIGAEAGTHTVVPSARWHVRVGDLTGIRVVRTGTAPDFILQGQNVDPDDLASYRAAADPGAASVDRASMTPNTSMVLIKLYAAKAPQLMVFSAGQFEGAAGDGITAVQGNMCGASLHRAAMSWAKGIPQINPVLDIGYKVAAHYGWTYQNMTCGPADANLSTLTQQEYWPRLATDIIAYSPRFCIIDLAIIMDRVWRDRGEAAWEADARAALDALVAARIVPIVVGPCPNSRFFPNAAMAKGDVAWAAITAICASEYPTAILVNVQEAIGQERTDGSPAPTPGNRWDYSEDPWYSDDGDMPNEAGYQAIAEAITAALDSRFDAMRGTNRLWPGPALSGD